LSAELTTSLRSERDVRVTAKTALFHVAITHLDVLQDRMQIPQVRTSFFRRPHIRLTHDFQQRDSGAIEVNEAGVAVGIVDVLPGIFFHMNASEAYAFRLLPIDVDVDITMLGNGEFVHTNLVTLGEIGIKVIFSGPATDRSDLTMSSKRCAER